MSADELESWLGEEDSAGAGWKKADESGETIGHERYLFQAPRSPPRPHNRVR